MILGVPCLRRVDMLIRLIESVFAGSVRPEKVLVVDNSGGMVRAEIERRANDPSAVLDGIYTRVEVIYSGENLGVAASWNRLLKAGAWIITNDDVVFNHRTFEELSTALEGGKLFVNGLGWALFGQRPEVAERIGYYDESFFPAYYEDDDYEVRLIEAGIATREDVLTSPVEHHGWASSRDEQTDQLSNAAEHRRIYDKSHANFVRKWKGPTDRVKAIKHALAELRATQQAKAASA